VGLRLQKKPYWNGTVWNDRLGGIRKTLALFVQPISRRARPTRRTRMIGIPKWISRSNEARIGFARVATALAFMSVGALAVGALAVGRLAIGKLVLKNGQIDRLSIDELQVNVLRVREQIVENS
jgi:Na+-transporting methylmalonyl-CoA/oxaloacetate decarboxylase beta subunit